jgi:hypothetical protein
MLLLLVWPLLLLLLMWVTSRICRKVWLLQQRLPPLLLPWCVVRLAGWLALLLWRLLL